MTFNPSLSSALGSKLSQLRRKRGLTLDGLAELSLVSRAAISALEQGNGNPRVQTLWNLADALGVNFSTLLDCQSARNFDPLSAPNNDPAWSARVAGPMRCSLHTAQPDRASGVSVIPAS
ncbi:helix-turn-helix domain-containing protein [Paracoccus sp. MA]|uniref:helix-turn-helix domain-containing protein n=1 Tax=Paracoccus sp. MA TaxID=2895796 RepID=UPI001E6476DF|nr:helix-turn-helix transcriptional regulator [Paracoccus sp. MA]UFM65941.1 helix-turn-helix domain-containing protein [Paracoccus sp. MA]